MPVTRLSKEQRGLIKKAFDAKPSIRNKSDIAMGVLKRIVEYKDYPGVMDDITEYIQILRHIRQDEQMGW